MVPGTRPIYVPGPAPRLPSLRFAVRGTGRALKYAAMSVGLLILSGAAVGEQSVLASLTDGRPSWAPALRAADPGVALSPNLAFPDGLVAVVAGTEADAPAAKGDSRTARLAPPHGPTVEPVESLLASASADLLPRVAFVRPRKADAAAAKSDAGRSDARPKPRAASSRLAEAALTSMYSAYLPEQVAIETPFELLLKDPRTPRPVAVLPPGLSGNGLDHWWSDRPLPKGIASAESIKCLAQAIYFESRGEPLLGQEAVAQVVINRVKNPAYPDDICGVVFQNRKWYNRCQFTFACDRIADVVRDPEAWAVAEDIATRYAKGELWLADVGAATHYHAKSVSPSWANLMRAVKTIGDHTFFMTRGGGWT
ncbi:hypothetical protein ATO13_11341 [Stappia sp. 22II-S9-Z10]|nr:hypothetical protein ATO13_11341 [Stappia sp. 22II-S9-Z10]